ncbi:MAG: hypothetical protein KAR01_06575 [Desulfocapsa sp.]|nr:hypothetical protein [Desulfocapsa sp.]
MKKLLLSCAFLLIANTANALEYQWKFVLPAMDNRETAVKVYELLDSIKGVYDVVPNIERNSVMFFYDDDYTNEDVAITVLTEAGYTIEKKMLLEEPKGAAMN